MKNRFQNKKGIIRSQLFKKSTRQIQTNEEKKR